MTDDSGSAAKTIFAGGTVLFLGLVLQTGLGFLVRLVVARFLGRVNYGAVSLGLTLMLSTSVLVVVGTDRGVGRYLPRYDDEERRRGVLVSAYQVVVPLALLASLAVVVSAGAIARYVFDAPEIAPVLRVFGLGIPLAAFVRLTVGTVQGRKESLPRVYIENIALPVARFGLVAGAVAVGFGAFGVAWAYAGAYGIAALIALVYLARNTSLLQFGTVEAIPMRRELLAFSAPLMVVATMNLVLSNLDTFMLGAFASTGDVGDYNAAYPLATLLTLVLTAFNFLFMPVISELHSEGAFDRLGRTYEVVAKWICLATLPLFLGLAFFPGVVIRLTFGPEYAAAAAALSLLAVGFFAHAIAGPNGNALTALGETRTVMYVNVLVAGSNAALNLVLIPRYGLLGAAAATTAGYFLMDGLYLAALYRELGIHPFRPALLRPAGAALAVWLALWGGVRYLATDPLVHALAVAAAFAPLYAVVVVRFGGIEREELMLLDAVEDRVGVDLNPVRRAAKRLAG